MGLDLASLTPEELAQLSTMMKRAELQSVQNEMDKQQGAILHAEKNAPWIDGGRYKDALKMLPPNPSLVGRPVPYPKMLYSVDYAPAQREYLAALRYRERRDEPGTRDEMIKQAEAAMQAATKEVHSAEDEAHWTSTGLWAPTVAGAADAEERRQRAIADAAAESRHADRRLSPAALAERTAAEDAHDGHLVEVPEQRRGPGRPPKASA